MPESGYAQAEDTAKQRLIDVLKSKGHDSIVYMNRYEGIPEEAWNASAPKQSGMSMLTAKHAMRTDMSDAAFKAKFPMAQDSYAFWDPRSVKGRFNQTRDETDPNMFKAKGGLIRKYAGGGAVAAAPAP